MKIEIAAMIRRRKELTEWADKNKIKTLKEIQITMEEDEAATITFKALMSMDAIQEIAEIFRGPEDEKNYWKDNRDDKQVEAGPDKKGPESEKEGA